MKPYASSSTRWAFASALVLALAAALSPTRAGFLTITVDPGSSAILFWDSDGDGYKDKDRTRTDKNNDGKITHGFGDLDAEKGIGSVWICKESDGDPQYGEVKLDGGGNTLASLEPFDFPSFASTTTLVASIDMAAFLAAGNPFTVGQVLNVTNGTIAQSPHLVFKDASSLPANPDFSRTLVASLPNFTGTARVISFDSVVPLQPSTVIPSITFAQRPIGKVAVLTWNSAPGAAYKVQFRATLNAPPVWQDFDVITAAAATATAEVPLSLLGAGAMPDKMFFRLVLPEPVVSGIDPALLSASGGQIYITGQSFAPGDMVLIGGVAMPVNFLSPTLLVVAVPPLAAGLYHVEILRDDDVIASLPASLTVTVGLALETLEPPGLPPGAPVFRPARLTPRPVVQGSQTAVVAGPAGEEIFPDKYGRVKVQFLWDRMGKLDISGSGEAVYVSVDLVIPGRGLDFVWATTCRSRNGDPLSTMGSNWSHSYDIRCGQNGADMEVWDGTGRHDTYFLQPDGSYSKRGFFRRGTLAAGLTFTLEFADKGRWEFRPLDGSPAAGKIARSIDRNGNQLQFNYNAAGRLSQVIDTLGRPNQVQYGANGRVSAVVDFSGRMVRYTYYGPGNPNGADGALLSIRTPVVNGTPTGNNFPLGKTTTFTYSTGQPDPRLNDNLLTITDPKGQTSRRIFYSPSPNPLDVDFDRVVSVQLGNPADPIDKPAVFTWLEQTPSPANGYARVKLIANDPVGNVTTRLFESRNLPVTHIQHTGRSTPGVAVTETTNLPAGKLRASDPQMFTAQIDWNLHYRPERITRPRGDALVFSWESDFDPAANSRVVGNLRTLREVGTAGEVLTWRAGHLAGFGTVESASPAVFCNIASANNTNDAGNAGDDGGIILVPLPQPPRRILGGSIGGPFDYDVETMIMHDVGHCIGLSHPNLSSVAGDYASVGSAGGDGTAPAPVVPLRKLLTVPSSASGSGSLAPDSTISTVAVESTILGPTMIDLGGRRLALPGGGIDLDAPQENPEIVVPEVPFDWQAFPNSITNPRGFTTTLAHDAAGSVTQIQAPIAGAVHTFTYNAFGQPTSHVHPAIGSGHLRVDTFSYYNVGSQNGYLSSFIVDDGGLNLTTAFEWNNRGALVRMVDARGNDWLRTRNQLDQVVRTMSPVVNGARNERNFIYDANDCIERIDIQNRDENGALGGNTHFSRTWSYDFRNFPTQRVDEIGCRTKKS